MLASLGSETHDRSGSSTRGPRWSTWVRDESARAHRYRGHYVALCGVTVLAASLTDPGWGRCQECAW